MVVIYFLLFFLFIFGPVLNSIGSWVDGILLTSVFIVFIHFIIKKNPLPGYLRTFSVLFLLFLIVGIVASLYIFITPESLFQIYFRPVRIIITLIAGYALVDRVLHRYRTNGMDKVIKFVFYSIVLHGLIMVMQFQIPAFKDFIYTYTTSGEFRSTFEYDFRMGGLSGSTGGAILSVVQSIGIICAPFLFKMRNTVIERIFLIFGIAVVLYSVFLCGRSGVWSILLFTPIAVYLSETKSKFVAALRIAALAFVAIFAIGLVITFLTTASEENPLATALGRTFDTFTNYEETGNFNDNTVNALQGHIILPDNAATWFFGDTDALVNTQFDRNLDSDIGVIRNIWSFGLIGACVFIYPMLKFLVLSYNNLQRSKAAKILFLISIITILFHFKENFLYTRMLFSIYSLILALYYLSLTKSNKVY